MKKVSRPVVGVCALLLLALASVVSACGSSSSSSSDDKVVLRNEFDYTDLDFQRQTLSGNAPITAYAYDSLVAFGPSDSEGKQTIVPYLAKSFDISPKSITFTLKKGPKCQDGTPITANVVKASLERMLDVSQSLATAFGGTQGSEKEKPTGIGPFTVSADEAAGTVTFTASKPSSELINGFLPWVGGATGVAKIVCPAGIKDPDKLRSGTEGSGPYELVSSKRGDRAVLKLNHDWKWGPNGTTADGMPENLEIRIVENDSTAANLATTGELDVMQIASSADAKRVADSGQFQDVKLPTVQPQGYVFGEADVIFINTRRIKDQNVRAALNMVVDRDQYIKADFSGDAKAATPVLGPVLPTSACYDEQAGTMVPQGSIEEARELLLQNGYTYKDNQLYNPDGSKTSVQFMAQDVDTPGSEYLVSQWKKLGLDVKFDNLASDVFGVEAVKGNFDMMHGTVPSIGWFSGPYPPEGQNLGAPRDPAYEREIQLATSASPEERCKHWANIQRMISGGSWMIPLMARTNSTFVRNGIDFELWGGLPPFASEPTYRLDGVER